MDLLISACKSYVKQHPDDMNGVLNLAAADLAGNRVDAALEVLMTFSNECVRGDLAQLLADDDRFDVLRDNEEFKKLLPHPE